MTGWQTVTVLVIAILCVAAIVMFALSCGIDGTALAGGIAAIVGLAGGVGGYQIARRKAKKSGG